MKHNEYIVPIGEEAKEFDEMFIGVIRRQPQLIRCKDCKCWKPSMTDVTEHVCHWGGFRKNADDYCSWAERKEK